MTRTQFGILYVTWVGALACPLAARAPRRDRGRAPSSCGFWPTALPLVLGHARLRREARVGRGRIELVRRLCGALAGLRPPRRSGKWFVYHLGDFAVYLAIVPVAVAPIVLWALARDGRAGSRPAGAFVALFAAANVTGLLVVAAFASSPWGFDRLHDRYGFYLLPLWLIGLVVWLDSGLPRPLIESTIGVVGALALALILPFGQLANEAGIDTVPGALWERVEAELAGPGPASGRLALGIFVVGLLAATFLLPRRIARVALPVAVAATFAGMSYFAWERMVGAPEDLVFAGGLERAWIDERVRQGRHGDEALRGHAVRLRPRAARDLPDRVLQLDGRSRGIRHRLDPGRPSDRTRRRVLVGRAPDSAGQTAGRRLRVHPAGHQARRPARGRGNGRPPRALARRRSACGSSARDRTSSCARRRAPRSARARAGGSRSG